MNGSLKKKLKAFSPYLIIIGIAYLIVPALIFTGSAALTYIILIGILPLTALLCCAHYCIHRGNDFLLALAAPIFFLPAMFIYPIASQSFLKALIYLIAYFLCGFLGLTIGDILARRDKSGAASGDRNGRSGSRPASARPERRPADRRPPERRPAERRAPVSEPDELDLDTPSERVPASAQRARRVAVGDSSDAVPFETADPYDDSSLDTSTTEADIDAILRDIHQRRSGE